MTAVRETETCHTFTLGDGVVLEVRLERDRLVVVNRGRGQDSLAVLPRGKTCVEILPVAALRSAVAS